MPGLQLRAMLLYIMKFAVIVVALLSLLVAAVAAEIVVIAVALFLTMG